MLLIDLALDVDPLPRRRGVSAVTPCGGREKLPPWGLFYKMLVPITSWETDGETVETVSDFILGGSKITADGDCSHEIKDTYSLEGKL